MLHATFASYILAHAIKSEIFKVVVLRSHAQRSKLNEDHRYLLQFQKAFILILIDSNCSMCEPISYFCLWTMSSYKEKTKHASITHDVNNTWIVNGQKIKADRSKLSSATTQKQSACIMKHEMLQMHAPSFFPRQQPIHFSIIYIYRSKDNFKHWIRNKHLYYKL